MRAAHSPRGEVVHVLAGGTRTSCGICIHTNRAGAPIEIDAERRLGKAANGAQLRWCGKCLGALAVDLDLSEWLVGILLWKEKQ